ncbi:hypothetical protein L596_010653 [Steinernema carpocapsae]|uniref:Uncharacterized protein n=1 Tax=Steinernema carpocapsae TaxID=34508 RepID=A0A4U5PIX9_STECR|nr:hypothetical protein L596_010653 [Steinernema carpocapsae]
MTTGRRQTCRRQTGRRQLVGDNWSAPASLALRTTTFKIAYPKPKMLQEASPGLHTPLFEIGSLEPVTRSQDYYPRCFQPVDRSLLSENGMCLAHTMACSSLLEHRSSSRPVNRSCFTVNEKRTSCLRPVSTDQLGTDQSSLTSWRRPVVLLR